MTRVPSIALPLVLLAALCIFGVTAAQVPFVRTPERVVTAMLRVAKVSKDDVVYDLGCGDGRIVITAAKRFGARGVGIDNDPVRISEAKANALASGVADRVRFIEQDLFESDLSEATVVTLYLVPSINLKLRPKLWRELKPGTRVVSHNYDMGDWVPKRKVGIGLHTVYYWVIPDEPPYESTAHPELARPFRRCGEHCTHNRIGGKVVSLDVPSVVAA